MTWCVPTKRDRLGITSFKAIGAFQPGLQVVAAEQFLYRQPQKPGNLGPQFRVIPMVINIVGHRPIGLPDLKSQAGNTQALLGQEGFDSHSLLYIHLFSHASLSLCIILHDFAKILDKISWGPVRLGKTQSAPMGHPLAVRPRVETLTIFTSLTTPVTRRVKVQQAQSEPVMLV